MDAADVLSYRVLLFERDGAVFRQAAAYPRKAVACVATHDLPTLAGWWTGADLVLDRRLGRSVAGDAEAERRRDRAALAELVGSSDGALNPGLVGAIHGFLAGSPAAVVLAQAEDLAGESDPVNVPGTEFDYPNWRRRLAISTDTLLATKSAQAMISAMRAAGR
jgi:glycogen debranching enzyme